MIDQQGLDVVTVPEFLLWINGSNFHAMFWWRALWIRDKYHNIIYFTGNPLVILLCSLESSSDDEEPEAAPVVRDTGDAAHVVS